MTVAESLATSASAVVGGAAAHQQYPFAGFDVGGGDLQLQGAIETVQVGVGLRRLPAERGDAMLLVIAQGGIGHRSQLGDLRRYRAIVFQLAAIGLQLRQIVKGLQAAEAPFQQGKMAPILPGGTVKLVDFLLQAGELRQHVRLGQSVHGVSPCACNSCVGSRKG